MSMTIGFIGLGTMGLPMAVNLARAGFEVVGYDAFEGSRRKAADAGITLADSPREVAAQAGDAVISMVRDHAQNREVILGKDGILAAEPRGMTVIVMSTLDPDTMDELAAEVEAAGDVTVIAAAVSGGQSGAQAGTLSVMASGPAAAVDAAAPYFDAVGAATFRYGPRPGASQGAKLANNMILGVVMNGVAEALRFAEHYGLPQDELLRLAQASTGDSWVVRNWDSVREWTRETALEVLQKDLRAAHLKGLEHSLPLPFNALSSTELMRSWDDLPRS